ncbi:MAG: hypothetical protein II707_04650, partial [Spirochaetales bacterium]|nr:hypothetical protein [Spirochaetales bacterium]
LVARQENARKAAESNVDAVKNAKFYMIRQAGDTGQLYGSVSSRDIARTLKEVARRLHISPETVRQLEMRIVRKLRREHSYLKEYLCS